MLSVTKFIKFYPLKSEKKKAQRQYKINIKYIIYILKGNIELQGQSLVQKLSITVQL